MIGLTNMVTPKIERIAEARNYGKFIISPLERGYGITLGNTLRRILLSSLEGAGRWILESPSKTELAFLGMGRPGVALQAARRPERFWGLSSLALKLLWVEVVLEISPVLF